MNTMLISPTHGSFLFDAVFKTNHAVELETTSHPIQYGAPITDHSFFQPEEVEFEFGFSDVMAETGVVNHSVNAFSSLQEIMREREPLTLVTRLKRYDDMLIVQMNIPDEQAQMYGLRGDIKLKQLLIVEAAIVKVQTKISSSKGNGSGSAKAAAVTDESVTEVDNRSYLRILADEFGINLNIPGSNGKSATTSQGSFSNNTTITGSGGQTTGTGAGRKK